MSNEELKNSISWNKFYLELTHKEIDTFKTYLVCKGDYHPNLFSIEEQWIYYTKLYKNI